MTAHTARLPRFNCGSGGAQFCQGCYQMEEDEHGEYVRWEDYECRKEAEMKLRGLLTETLECVEYRRVMTGSAEHSRALGALRDRIREALADEKDLTP